jgi:hypothetical protein
MDAHLIDDSRVIKVSFNDGNLLIDEDKKTFIKRLLENCHCNFLLGAGFSIEQVPTLGSREKWSENIFVNDNQNLNEEIRAAWFAEYFKAILHPISDEKECDEQIRFVRTVCEIIRNRGNSTIPRRANIFTTNYDPFIEFALEASGVNYNDGFCGREHPKYSTSSFSRIQTTQTLMLEYAQQVPTINLIKLHGSLSWTNNNGSIYYTSPASNIKSLSNFYSPLESIDGWSDIVSLLGSEYSDDALLSLRNYVENLSTKEKNQLLSFASAYEKLYIVSATKAKFYQTVFDLVYYELLRLYANELDRTNCLLVSFGFSFADEHILDITRRALENSALQLLVCCYKEETLNDCALKFKGIPNVSFLYVDEGEDGFNLTTLNNLLEEVTGCNVR